MADIFDTLEPYFSIFDPAEGQNKMMSTPTSMENKEFFSINTNLIPSKRSSIPTFDHLDMFWTYPGRDQESIKTFVMQKISSIKI